jgi:hypothetical protein
MLSAEALQDLMAQMRGSPVWAPSSEPTQRPLIVEALSVRLASLARASPSLTFRQIALERMDAIDALGLGSEDPEYLSQRLTELAPADWEALAAAVFQSGKATLDRLREHAEAPESPVALWAGGADAFRVVGQTLLWADHYLVDDATAEVLLESPERPEPRQLCDALARESRLRPLLEVGILLLVPEQVAHVLVAETAYAATAVDLEDPAFARYVVDQLWLEGPTAREVLFVHARDGDDLGQMFFYGRMDEANDDGTFTSALAHRYDPGHDYRPWMDQVLRQTAARRVQHLNLDLAVAAAVGGRRLALTPFEARLLRQKGAIAAEPSPLLWADVPSLPSADPATLARIANEDATVAALRQTVRRAMSAAGGSEGGRIAAEEIGVQLREDAQSLQATIRRDHLWRIAMPSGLGAAGLVIGAVAAGPVGLVVAALGTAAGLVPAIADHGAHRANAAYAVLLADRSRRDRSQPRR